MRAIESAVVLGRTPKAWSSHKTWMTCTATNKLGKENSLTEKGGTVGPHDMLTGSGTDGRAISGDKTCSNWTNSADGAGTARLGHYDKQGGGENPNSWNSAHDSRGCSQTNLVSTGGAGAFYCFAQ
jgi:hypothetical protein